LLLIGTVGCAPRLTMEVRAYADPDAKLAQLDRFALTHQPATPERATLLAKQVAVDLQQFLVRWDYRPVETQSMPVGTSDNPLLMKQVAAVARQQLAQRGYTLDARDPQFLISVDYSTGPYEYFVPGSVRADADDQVTASTITGVDGTRSVQSVTETVEGNPTVTPGRHALTYVNAVAIYVYPVRDPREPIWQASAIAVDHYPDFRRVMPYLVAEALREFPYPSGEPQRRTVELAE
jgi:hypothetical protein